MWLTGESWQTVADEASCLFIAEICIAEFRQRPVVQDIWALETLAIILTGMLRTLIYIHLAVLSFITWTDAQTCQRLIFFLKSVFMQHLQAPKYVDHILSSLRGQLHFWIIAVKNNITFPLPVVLFVKILCWCELQSFGDVCLLCFIMELDGLDDPVTQDTP